jgi:hypothetical protein
MVAPSSLLAKSMFLRLRVIGLIVQHWWNRARSAVLEDAAPVLQRFLYPFPSRCAIVKAQDRSFRQAPTGHDPFNPDANSSVVTLRIERLSGGRALLRRGSLVSYVSEQTTPD